jgi:hypothetical protein
MILKVTNRSGASVTHQGQALVDGASFYLEIAGVLCDADNKITHVRYDSDATTWTAITANHDYEIGNIAQGGGSTRLLGNM